MEEHVENKSPAWHSTGSAPTRRRMPQDGDASSEKSHAPLRTPTRMCPAFSSLIVGHTSIAPKVAASFRHVGTRPAQRV